MSSGSARSILVIDSGIGGLSVCQSILEHTPSTQIIYFADDAYFPYGLLSEDDLVSRLHSVVEGMLENYQPELVVLACNTVSTLVLPALRARYDIPFVGVVPAIKPAAQVTKTKKIGLLATPATVRRPYIDSLVSDFASDCQVVRVGTNDLVLQAERLLAGHQVSSDVLMQSIQPLLVTHNNSKVDTVVLGCTHFPFLRNELQELMPDVELIDSGQAIARRVVDLMGGVVADPVAVSHRLYFSKKLPDTEKFTPALKSLGLNVVDFSLSTF